MALRDDFSRVRPPATRSRAIYTRKNASSELSSVSQTTDAWEDFKKVPDVKREAVSMPPSSTSQPVLAKASSSRNGVKIAIKVKAKKDVADEFYFDPKFEDMSITRSSKSTAKNTALSFAKSQKTEDASDPFEFKVVENGSSKKASSTPAMSSSYDSGINPGSQESVASTSSKSSSSSHPGTDSKDVFKKPARPPPKARGAVATKPPPPVAKGDSYPPSKKRAASKTHDMGPPRKQSSPEKPRIASPTSDPYDFQVSDALPSTSTAPPIEPLPSHSATDMEITEKLEDGKIKVKRSQKDLFVVVHNTRPSEECLHTGAVSDIQSEITFLLDNLRCTGNNLITRCLSAVSLASKLLEPMFRVHFSAHAGGGVFEALEDAGGDGNLGMGLAVLTLVLSTDNLRMDLDEKGMKVLKGVLEGKGETSGVDKRVLDGVAAVVRRTKIGEDAGSEMLTAPRLILEAMMTMKLGTQLHWFIEEIRKQGFLEHFVQHSASCLTALEKNPTKANLNSAIRLTDFLYKVLHNNRENAEFFVSHSSCAGFVSLVRIFNLAFDLARNSKKCVGEMKTLLSRLLHSTLTVLLCLTGYAEPFRAMMGSQPALVENLIRCCSDLSSVFPVEKSREILIQALLCLVNLTFRCRSNCSSFMAARKPESSNTFDLLTALVQLTKQAKEEAEASGDDLDRCTEQLTRDIKTKVDPNDSISDMLEKAGENMEHFAIMCYSGILFAHLVSQNENAKTSLHSHLTTVFGSVQAGIDVSVGAIRRFIDFITDADCRHSKAVVTTTDSKAEQSHPVDEMHNSVDILETYAYDHRS